MRRDLWMGGLHGVACNKYIEHVGFYIKVSLGQNRNLPKSRYLEPTGSFFQWNFGIPYFVFPRRLGSTDLT